MPHHYSHHWSGLLLSVGLLAFSVQGFSVDDDEEDSAHDGGIFMSTMETRRITVVLLFNIAYVLCRWNAVDKRGREGPSGLDMASSVAYAVLGVAWASGTFPGAVFHGMGAALAVYWALNFFRAVPPTAHHTRIVHPKTVTVRAGGPLLASSLLLRAQD